MGEIDFVHKVMKYLTIFLDFKIGARRSWRGSVQDIVGCFP